MGRKGCRGIRPWRAVRGALIMLALLSGAAHAKSWEQWAPAPLASDSAYAALAARPADSLGTDEFAWMQVQRDWRAQRLQEALEARSSSITSTGLVHASRPGDGRFAKLASRPYAELSDSDRTWLVVENAAQRADREHLSTVGTVAIVVIVAGVAAVAGAIWGVHAAVGNIFGGH